MSEKDLEQKPDSKPDDKIEQHPTVLTDAEEDDDIRDYIPEPPDGGWGWVVMIASFFNWFVIDGIAYTFGVFLNDYVDYFDTSVGTTSLASSLFTGFSLLNGPIVGAFINKYGCRAVAIAGALIAAAAFALSTFSANIEMMIIVYGIVGGFAMGMIGMPSVIGVGHYFDKRRSLATGIAVCGGGVGTFCIAPLSKYLLQEYGWRGAHLILAGIFLQVCLISSTIRPLTVKRKKLVINDEGVEENGNLLKESGPASKPGDYIKSGGHLVSKQELTSPMARKDIFLAASIHDLAEYKSHHSLDAKEHVVSMTKVPSHDYQSRSKCLSCLPLAMSDILSEMVDVSVLKNKAMILMCLANAFAMFAYIVPFVFVTPRAVSLGIEPNKAAILISTMGISSTVGRVVIGGIATLPKVPPLLANNLTITMAGVVVAMMPLAKTYTTMMVASAAYGFFSSTYMSLASVITCDLVGLDKLTSAFGLLSMVRGIGLVAGPPITGKLYDLTLSYDTTFFVGGGCLLISAALHFVLHHPYFKTQKQHQGSSEHAESSNS